MKGHCETCGNTQISLEVVVTDPYQADDGKLVVTAQVVSGVCPGCSEPVSVSNLPDMTWEVNPDGSPAP